MKEEAHDCTGGCVVELIEGTQPSIAGGALSRAWGKKKGQREVALCARARKREATSGSAIN